MIITFGDTSRQTKGCSLMSTSRSLPSFTVFGLPVSRVTIGKVNAEGKLVTRTFVRDESSKRLVPVNTGAETDGTDALDPHTDTTPKAS